MPIVDLKLYHAVGLVVTEFIVVRGGLIAVKCF